MELTKKILNIAAAFSIAVLSLSVFVYSIRDSKAVAAPQTDGDGYSVAGVLNFQYGNNTITTVIGYNAKTADMKVLAHKKDISIK